MAKEQNKCDNCGHNLNAEDVKRMRCPNCKYDWRKNVTGPGAKK